MTACTVTVVTKQTLCPNVQNATNSSRRIVSGLWMALGILSASSALAVSSSSQGIWATGSRTVNPIVTTATLTQCYQSVGDVATQLWIERSRPLTSSGMSPALYVWSVRLHLRGPKTFTPLRASPSVPLVQEYKTSKRFADPFRMLLTVIYSILQYYRPMSYKWKLRSLELFFFSWKS